MQLLTLRSPDQSWERKQSRDQFMKACRKKCVRVAVRKRPNDSDRRMSTGRSFQTNGAAWLKARLAIMRLEGLPVKLAL